MDGTSRHVHWRNDTLIKEQYCVKYKCIWFCVCIHFLWIKQDTTYAKITKHLGCHIKCDLFFGSSRFVTNETAVYVLTLQGLDIYKKVDSQISIEGNMLCRWLSAPWCWGTVKLGQWKVSIRWPLTYKENDFTFSLQMMARCLCTLHLDKNECSIW